MGGIKVNQAKINDSGIEFDRRWMLIDSNGTFLSAREIPDLLLFSTSIDAEKNAITVQHNKQNSAISFPLVPEVAQKQISEIWGDKINTIHPFKVVSEFFSDVLKRKVLAVYSELDNNRIKKNSLQKKYSLNLADAYPFLIIGENSVEALTNVYQKKIEMKRFRPNFIFSGGQAFEEDQWKNFKIGESFFQCEKKCARCKVIGLSPETAVFDKNILTLMNNVRKEKNEIFMGMNLTLIHGNYIEVNMEIVAG